MFIPREKITKWVKRHNLKLNESDARRAFEDAVHFKEEENICFCSGPECECPALSPEPIRRGRI